MDFNEVSNVGARKKINELNKHLGEKISKLSTDVIKHQVSQDIAYWDLRQKLHQVEGNRERLQQNLVDVQMQFEAVSSQYHEETLKRPEILNKLDSTREICDVLEEYSSRLKQTLSRCKADQDTLCAAYQSSAELVHGIKTAHEQDNEKHIQIIRDLEEKVKMCEANQSRGMEMFNVMTQQLERQTSLAREQLAAAQSASQQLAHVNGKLDSANGQLEKKDEVITQLKNEIKKLNDNFNMEMDGAQKVLEKRDRDLKEAIEAADDLKKALINQEDFSKTLIEKNNKLEDKISALQEENETTAKQSEKLHEELQAASKSLDSAKAEIANLLQENKKLTQLVQSKEETEKALNWENEKLKELKSVMEEENNILKDKYKHKDDECERFMERVQQLVAETNTLRAEIEAIDQKFKAYKESTERVIQDLNHTIENQKIEVNSKEATAAQLICDLEQSNQTNNKLRDSLQTCIRDLENERANFKEIESKLITRIEQLEETLKVKEDELSRNLTALLEMKNVKDQLVKKISDLQVTSDNLQKENSHSLLTVLPPEPDDNAVCLTPSQREKPSGQNQNAQKENIYEMFSDESMEDSMGFGKRSHVWRPRTAFALKRPRPISSEFESKQTSMQVNDLLAPPRMLPGKFSALNKEKKSKKK